MDMYAPGGVGGSKISYISSKPAVASAADPIKLNRSASPLTSDPRTLIYQLRSVASTIVSAVGSLSLPPSSTAVTR